MKFMILFNVAKMLYSGIFRNLLKKAVDDPNEEWDDIVLDMCDRIFDYKEDKNK